MTAQDQTQDAAGPALTGMELADAVEAVRAGLMEGAVRGAGANVRFEVGEIHMEFTVELQRTRTGRGGVKAWIVEAGAEAARTSGATHTVSLTLHPKSATGGFLEIKAPDDANPSSVQYEG
ncbi:MULTISPECIES: trypco2 family protein [unclassified Streptomyces]|uniref:trypco2 family protein n=1 Tax=unclassified Streptomyces TaxID=2593676 RepID=UPI00344F636F